MARGWESKSVESQQADREAQGSSRPEMTVEERTIQSRRNTLMLARARASAELTAATEPAHRAMLEAALKAIDEQIEKPS